MARPDDADLVGLDGGLDLELLVLDRLDDLLGLLRRDALLDLDGLADGAQRGRLDLLVVERLDGDPRLTRRVSRMSTTDFSLPSSSEVSVSSSSFSFHSIFDFEPRKSNRVAISLEACWTALETSCRSTLLTTSKENSWGMGGIAIGSGCG